MKSFKELGMTVALTAVLLGSVGFSPEGKHTEISNASNYVQVSGGILA